MFRSKLIAFLNKQVWLQYIFVILPCIMVSVYGFAYLMDYLGVYDSLSYNSSISERAYDVGSLKEVAYTEVDDEGASHAVIGTDVISEELVKVDDVILYVQIYGQDWFNIVTGSGESVTTEHCSLFDVEKYNKEGAVVTYGDFSHEYEYGAVVCGLTISPEGMWRVYFMNSDEWYYDLDSLSMVELLPGEGGSYRVRVYNRYEVTFDDFDINFCWNLPTDNLYYNEMAGSFVRNISKDYGWTFILRANLLVVILAVAIYCLLLKEIERRKELSLLDNPYLLRADMFALCLAIFLVPFTLIMP